jgi:hypothetical protein
MILAPVICYFVYAAGDNNGQRSRKECLMIG